MADLKPLNAPAATAKEQFLGGGKKASVASKRPQVKKLSDNSGRYIKLGLYGDYGSGKTFSLVDLLTEFGLKILVITTDIGGDGLSTVVAELQARGRGDLAETNIVHVTLETYDQFVEFTENPTLFFPDIYEWDPDILAWDGFSGFQQYQLAEYVDEQDTVYDNQGKQITLKYWGEVKKATVKNLNRFLYMHNKKTGKLWHKIVTMLSTDVAQEEELARTTDEKERLKLKKDVKAPFIQGAAARLIGPAFDFFALCSTRRVEGPDGKKVTQFVYHTEPTLKQKAKVRGVKFDPVIPGNMGAVWAALTKAYMVQPGQVSEEVKEAA